MSKLLLLSSILLSIHIILGTKIANSNPRIINGNPTSASSYPFIVDLHHVDSDTTFCTGSLVRLQFPATILTAAHCVDGDDDIKVYLFRSDADAPKSYSNDFTSHNIGKIVLHPNYNKDSLDQDIALIFLNEDVSNDERLSVVKISSNSECCSSNDALQVIGYGVEQHEGESTDTLEYANKKFMDRDECGKIIGEYLQSDNFYLGEFQICARGDNTDSCQGDSGGPLVKTNTKTQAGITSFGYGEPACNYQYNGQTLPSVYTNVGFYKQWIDDRIEYVQNCVSFSNDNANVNANADTDTDTDTDPYYYYSDTTSATDSDTDTGTGTGTTETCKGTGGYDCCKNSLDGSESVTDSNYNGNSVMRYNVNNLIMVTLCWIVFKMYYSFC